MNSLIVFVWAVAVSSLSIPRELTDGPEQWLVRLQRMVRAADWQPVDEWINHDPFNVIDAFGLDFEDVEEARDATMAKYHLTQI